MPAANGNVEYKDTENLLNSSDESDVPVPDVFQHFLNTTLEDTIDGYDTFGLNQSSIDETNKANIYDLPGTKKLK